MDEEVINFNHNFSKSLWILRTPENEENIGGPVHGLALKQVVVFVASSSSNSIDVVAANYQAAFHK